jgi:hypothetical protein
VADSLEGFVAGPHHHDVITPFSETKMARACRGNFSAPLPGVDVVVGCGVGVVVAVLLQRKLESPGRCKGEFFSSSFGVKLK